MPREHQDYPAINIASKYGMTRVVVNGYDTLFVDANKHSATDPAAGWTISGVRYGVSIHLKRDGARWTTANNNRGDLYMSRSVSTGQYSTDQGSFSARDKAFAEAVRIASMIALPFFEQAERVNLNNQAARAETEIDKLNAELTAQVEILADLEHKLATA